MAPTGRAAKVFSGYSKFPASTIHRKIYRHSINGEIPGLKENRDSNTVYIVDEASMIPSGWSSRNESSTASAKGIGTTQGLGEFRTARSFGGGRSGGGNDLLADLLTYVFAGNNNRLIFVGDKAQLPPVGENFSAAMDTATLRSLGLKVSSVTLTRIVRQGPRTGVLANAVNIRREMHEFPDRIPSPMVEGFDDVFTVTSEDLPEVIDTAYRKEGIDNTIIITRSNRRAGEFNRAIRSQVLYYEEELVKDEPIMIVKNNYFWTKAENRRDIDFMANGDIFRVTRVIGTECKYGFRFADIELVQLDSDNEPIEIQPIQVKIFLETLDNDAATLSNDRLAQLYQNMLRTDYIDCPNPIQALANDPYWNALQAKYAYCVTCHKAQGGQWSNVIVDISYINPESVGQDLYRWMYTATTRAINTLTYLVDRPTM